MASSNSTEKINSPGEQGVLSNDKLREKYKAVLIIAQKAKDARDEAIKENKLVLTENMNLREKIKMLEKKYSTAEEMLAALTEQKLKFAMETDDLKKQQAIYLQELKSKESIEIEAESFKRQYNRLLKENEDLIKKFGLSESDYVQLKKNFEELKTSYETLNQSYSNIQCDKEELDKSFKETLERLCALEQSQQIVNLALSYKYNVNIGDFKQWVDVINSDMGNSLDQHYSLSEIEVLKADKEKCLSSLNSLSKEKENLELEIIDLNERIKNLHTELDFANSDRDKMMTNLEKVASETKQLIENSEKLTDEIDVLKLENNRQGQLISSLQNDKTNMSKIIKEYEEEINRLFSQVRESQKVNEELMLKLDSLDNPLQDSISNETTKSVDALEENQDCVTRESSDDSCLRKEHLKKEASVNTELNQLQEELQAFSCEIIKYKKIADEFEMKYENTMKELVDKNELIEQQNISLTELKSKLTSFEEQQENLNSNLSQCKVQLFSALEDLSHAEEIKNNLKEESDLRNMKLLEAIKAVEEKESLLNEMTNRIKFLEDKLAEKGNNSEEGVEGQIDLLNLSSWVMRPNSFKRAVWNDMMQEYKEKFDAYKGEIARLQGIINEYQENNEKLSSDNLKLTKQIKDILNEQTSDNNNLVQKLTCLQDTMQSQIKEKQSNINKLESEITSLKSERPALLEQNENMSAENADLKEKIDHLLIKHSEEFATLTQQNAELHEEIESHLLQASEKNTELTDLKDDLSDLIKNREELESYRDILNKEKSQLNELIKNTISNLVDINNEVLLEILKLKKDNVVPSEKCSEVDSHSMHSQLCHFSDKLKENINIMRHEISNVLELHDSLLNENNKIKEQLENLQSESSKVPELLEKLKSSTSDIDKLNGIINELKEENMLLSKNSEELSLNNKDLVEKLVQVNNECSGLKLHCADLEALLEKNSHERKTESDALNFEIKKLNDLLDLNKTNIECNVAELQSNNNELIKANDLLNEENMSLKKHMIDKENLIKSFETQLKNVQSSLSDNELKLKQTQEKRDQMKVVYEEEIGQLKEKLKQLSLLNDNLNKDLSSFKDNLESLRATHVEEKSFLVSNNDKLQAELNNCNELLTFKTLELKENNRIWAGRFSSLKIALIAVNKGRKEIKNHFECVENLFASFIGQIQEPLQEKINSVIQHSVSAAKHELINEMHQMNQALKERGETISKLEFSVSEYQAKLKQLTVHHEDVTAELLKVKEELEEQDKNLKEKESYIKQLESENEQLKESHDNTADTDVLSTSTISRTEEHSRLRDVEESFEDRYSKLKILAVKMKKRIGELTQNLETERSKFTVEKNEFQEKINSMSMAVKNAQKLQELFDQSLDERDSLQKTNKSLENALEELKASEETLKNKIISLESSNQSIPVMKKHIDSLNGVIKDSKAELHKLQMEIKAESIKYEELKKINTKLESKVQELTRSLEQAKQQGKNSNVLELEMKNYEKIIADLSSQLNSEKGNVKNLQNEIESISNTKVGLEEQIAILENQLKVEENRNQLTNENLNNCRSKLEECTAQIESLNNEIEVAQKELCNEKHKTEALTLEMSEVTSEFSKKEMSMTSKIGTLQEQIRSLETALVSTKQELDTSKREIDHLHEEYESYKLRAQTILAKRKGDFVTHGEKEAKEEVERLQKDCKLLEEKLEAYVGEIEMLNTRVSSLTLEKTRSDNRYEEIKQALQQKITDFDVLNTEYYNYKISNEATIESLKGELSKKKHEYQTELSHQKKIIDDLTSEFKQKEEFLQSQSKDKLDNAGFSMSFHESIPLPSEREDGEGSESVPSPKMRRHSSIVPLDILLNNPIVDESKVSVLQEQVEKLRRELTSYEVRCRHLSSLLSETEKDSARNLHQNKLLKEELRRLERSLERQPHVANTEYLKNVVFKFVTLPHGDERSRLVPVLDTLLKLSPEETHKLNAVAKGEAQAGWSSYLQSWTGL